MEKLAVQLRPGDRIVIDGHTETVTSRPELSPSGNCFIATDARSEADAHVVDSFAKIPLADGPGRVRVAHRREPELNEET